MDMTKPLTMRTFNQNPPADLAPDQFRGARIRAALLEVAGELSCRPEPRHAWDALGRADAELRSAWTDKDVQLCRDALTAALAEGRDVYVETRRRVHRYFAEKLSSTMYGFEQIPAEDLAAQVRDTAREMADVQKAAADVAFRESPAACATLHNEALEARAKLDDVISITAPRMIARKSRHLVRT